MMINLFYKTIRILTWIIIIIAIILVLSKLLPFIGDIFQTITKLIKGFADKLSSVKDLVMLASGDYNHYESGENRQN